MTDTDYEEIMEIIDPPEPPALPVNLLLVQGLVYLGIWVGGTIAEMWI